MKGIRAVLFAVVIILLSDSCEKVFEYSPYGISIEDEYRNTTSENLNKLHEADRNFTDTVFTVALISDVHYFYNDLKKAVDFINTRPEVDFVIVDGDLTDLGLQQEYKLMHNIMLNLNSPYLTVIGNHDYLSNGDKIYDLVFGDRNYSFSFGNTHFILFDDIFWESEKTPDFDWLQNQCSEHGGYNHTIVCNHIPSFTDQFTQEAASRYYDILQSSNTSISINGHQHEYETGILTGGIPYVILPRIDAHMLVELKVSSSSVSMDTLTFQ